jgi:hypothetical protein
VTEANFTQVLHELDELDAELEAIRVAVDEGEETFSAAPTAREVALAHLEGAMRHTVVSARALVKGARWEEPEDNLDVIEALVEHDVLPRRVGATLVGLTEYATNHGDDSGWEAEEEATSAFERLSEGVDALAEYQEYMHHFLREWEQ